MHCAPLLRFVVECAASGKGLPGIRLHVHSWGTASAAGSTALAERVLGQGHTLDAAVAPVVAEPAGAAAGTGEGHPTVLCAPKVPKGKPPWDETFLAGCRDLLLGSQYGRRTPGACSCTSTGAEGREQSEWDYL